MRTKHIIIIAVAIAAIAGALLYSYFNQPEQYLPTRDSSEPTTKESCEAVNGSWEEIGPNPIFRCNVPTSDAGKVCSSSSECEGSCIAELSREDYEKAIHGTVKTNGSCTAWNIVYGCRAFVEGGKVNGILCVD